jgi:hypothetical protein
MCTVSGPSETVLRDGDGIDARTALTAPILARVR